MSYTGGMVYVKVWVGHNRYKGDEALTYQSAEVLPAGSLVRIPLKNDLVLGVVAGQTTHPNFPTKPLQPINGLPPLPPQLLAVADWLHQFYATSFSSTLQLILPSLLSDRRVAEASGAPAPSQQPTTNLPPLTKQQAAALAQITDPNTYLLHGETGTGKTRIYLELAQRTLAAGRSAIILTPEIGLTSQLSLNLQAHLPGRVIILHSQLTAKERELVWLRLATAPEPQVVVGPRSALFSPLPAVGLIVVDEAHDNSYKQDQTPRYNALRAAAKLAELHKSILVLGSATPSIDDYYVAEQRHKPILRLTELAKGAALPPTVQIIDLKDRGLFSGSSHLSKPLLAGLKTALDRGEQSLLYLNRRGTARLVLCENCGWQAMCPHCDIPLIYHGDSHTLRCHTCGFQQGVLVSCPSCGHPSIIYKLIGTKAIADEVQRAFPDARVARFDTDNKKSERLEQHYEAVRRGDVDILIGTQMLGKGLDLPKLTTLGIVLADTSLSLPDFSAGERTYQQLSQVLGRIGRGHGDGSQAPQAYVQTYQPENAILRAALKRDWDSFYLAELDGRRKFGFPPFYHLLKISCRRASTSTAEKAVNDFAVELNKLGLPIIIDGPAPAFHEKVAGKYSWQLVIKSKQRSHLLEVVKQLPTTAGWSFDLDPGDLL